MNNLAPPEVAPGQQFRGGEVPEIHWDIYDDECNCVFQRIGDWTNPYIGRTLRVRMCCIWAELYKDYPQFVQEIPASYSKNTGKYESEPREWDGEFDMPPAFWHRQLASQLGMSVDDVREKFKGQMPPKGIPRRAKMTQGVAMNEHEVIGQQTMRIQDLESQLSKTVGVIHAIKNGELEIDRVELSDNGFKVTGEESDGGK